MKSRAWLPFAVALLALGRHHLVDCASHFYAHPLVARRALFYAAGGICSASLFGLVWLLTPWRPSSVRVAVSLACAWGILEESQVTICRIGLGIDQPATSPMWRGLCDQLSGLPISTMMLVVPVVVFYWLARKDRDGYETPIP